MARGSRPVADQAENSRRSRWLHPDRRRVKAQPAGAGSASTSARIVDSPRQDGEVALSAGVRSRNTRVSRAARSVPQMPRGRKSTKAEKTAPITSGQDSVKV